MVNMQLLNPAAASLSSCLYSSHSQTDVVMRRGGAYFKPVI